MLEDLRRQRLCTPVRRTSPYFTLSSIHTRTCAYPAEARVSCHDSRPPGACCRSPVVPVEVTFDVPWSPCMPQSAPRLATSTTGATWKRSWRYGDAGFPPYERPAPPCDPRCVTDLPSGPSPSPPHPLAAFCRFGGITRIAAAARPGSAVLDSPSCCRPGTRPGSTPACMP